MRKQVCEHCGNIYIPSNRGRNSYKKKNPDWTCSRCGHKNKRKQRSVKIQKKVKEAGV